MTTENTRSNDRKAPVTHKDVKCAYLMSLDIGEVGQMLAGHTNPVKVLDRVIEDMANGRKDTEELEALREKFADAKASTGQRGRKPVALGEARAFRVQQLTDANGDAGDVFIRLPLAALGVSKGQSVTAEYGTDGKITVSF